jgi:hypothetical protein
LTTAAPVAAHKTALARHVRGSLDSHICDESGSAQHGTAIYTLSDPRDIRATRYVGQTSAPRRRLRQHVDTARLWLPDVTPWWIRSTRHRPLYEWIRALYADGHRFPVMVIWQWVEGTGEARLAERALILRHLTERASLLNVECGLLGPQLPLL